MFGRTPEARLEERAGLFAALGDPTRLALVERLSSGGPASISRLAAGSGVTRQAITKHLMILEAAGAVRGARSGREHLWELNPKQLLEARRTLERIAGEWGDALTRLKAHVEGS
jgi:DNA-binding transcriptional ArsR family regulator